MALYIVRDVVFFGSRHVDVKLELIWNHLDVLGIRLGLYFQNPEPDPTVP